MLTQFGANQALINKNYIHKPIASEKSQLKMLEQMLSKV